MRRDDGRLASHAEAVAADEEPRDTSVAPFEVRDLLGALHSERLLDSIDVQLAELCVRRGEAGEEALAVALATALLSRARREGHSALTLGQLVDEAREAVRLVERALEAAGAPLPDLLPSGDEPWWGDVLARSAVVNDGRTAPVLPLVLRDGLLQFRRYFDAEGRIATTVQRLLQLSAETGGDAFSIVTGGPGTGKTTRVAELIVDLSIKQPGLRVALAAPTGKAAARLTDSIRQRLERVATETGRRIEFPGEARTLHRLLGYSPQRDTFRANADTPLDDDLVIVDEASMVDVLLLDALLKGLKPGARLMLVGDHNQLASVDAGDVLGALCRAAQDAGAEGALGGAVTWLEKSWRFAEHPAIGTLAAAILAGDAEGVLRVCGDGEVGEVQLRPPAASTDALVEPIAAHLEKCLAAEGPGALLDALEGFRILAPEREGRMGVNGINAAVERWLARQGHAVSEPWYHRRPVLVTANDYLTGVFNGDVGVVWREAGKVAVYFRANDGALRAIAPLRLPVTETAWAMTVHKAQGSEFDDVLVVIPERDSRVMSRELLYTAATRARRGVTLVASDSAIRGAVARTTGRTSGLEGRLREAMGSAG